MKEQLYKDILLIESIKDIIEESHNKDLIIFKIIDLCYKIFNNIFFSEKDIKCPYLKTGYFKDKIISEGFVLKSINDLGLIIELNNYYNNIFNESIEEIKNYALDFFNKATELNRFLLIDSRYEEIQVTDFRSVIKWIEISLDNGYDQIRNILNNKIDIENLMIDKLKDYYNNSPQGYQMTYVHLFGIEYASVLKDLSIKKINMKATGKDSLYVEIGKGIKLSKFVKKI